MRPAKGLRGLTSMGIAAVLWSGVAAHAGSARDYLNAPVDTWLLNYNAGYTTSVTPEDGTDTIPAFGPTCSLNRWSLRALWTTGAAPAASRSFCLTRSSTPARVSFRASTNGVSDVGFLWQMNIFGGPALTREQFRILHSANVLELSFVGDDAAWILPAKLSDQPEPANRWMISPTVNFRLHARSRLELDRDVDLGAHLHRQWELSRERGADAHTEAAAAARGALEPQRDRRLYGSRRTLITISAERRASMGSTRTTWRIRFGSEREWGFVSRGADMALNYERVVAKPASEPYSQTVRLTVRQLW